MIGRCPDCGRPTQGDCPCWMVGVGRATCPHGCEDGRVYTGYFNQWYACPVHAGGAEGCSILRRREPEDPERDDG